MCVCVCVSQRCGDPSSSDSSRYPQGLYGLTSNPQMALMETEVGFIQKQWHNDHLWDSGIVFLCLLSWLNPICWWLAPAFYWIQWYPYLPALGGIPLHNSSRVARLVTKMMVPAQNLSRTPSEARKRRAKTWGCNGINGDSVSILLLQYYYYYYYYLNYLFIINIVVIISPLGVQLRVQHQVFTPNT